MFVLPSLWKSFCVFCVRVSFIKVKQHLSSLLRPAPLAASAVTSSFTSCICTFTSRYITSYHHLLFISPFCFPHISTSSRLFPPPPFVSLSLSLFHLPTICLLYLYTFTWLLCAIRRNLHLLIFSSYIFSSIIYSHLHICT